MREGSPVIDEVLCLVESNRPPGNFPDLVSLARSAGYSVVVATSDTSSVDTSEWDRVATVEVDTTDGRAIADAVRDDNLAGILTAHDFYVPAAAVAAELLGLPGPDPDAVATCRRKDQQRSALASAGVPQPHFGIAATPAAAVQVADQMGYPVVVKPVALADSIGVVVCADADAVRDHAKALGEDSSFNPRRPAPGHVAGEVLVESVLRGPEYAVEVFDGQAIAVCQTQFEPPPGFVEYQFLVSGPADPLDPAARAVLMSTAEAAAAALGLGFGPIHVEMRLDDGVARIVEVNSRLAGGRVPRLHRLTLGVDLLSAWLGAATAKPRPPSPTQHRAGVLRFLHLGEQAPGAAQTISTGSFTGEFTLLETGAVGARPLRTSDLGGWAIATGSDVVACLHELDELWTHLGEQTTLWWPGRPESRP